MADNKTKNKGLSPMFRIIAAVYILYLSYDLIKDFADIPANQRWFFVITIVIFVAASIWFLLSAYQDIKQQKALEDAEKAAEAAQPDAKEELAELNDAEEPEQDIYPNEDKNTDE